MIGQPSSYLRSDHLNLAGLDNGVVGRRGEMRTLPFIVSCSLGKSGDTRYLRRDNGIQCQQVEQSHPLKKAQGFR
ncbi:hypothetical protein PoB_006950200, partial [Plakobranchus ocellatus]